MIILGHNVLFMACMYTRNCILRKIVYEDVEMTRVTLVGLVEASIKIIKSKKRVFFSTYIIEWILFHVLIAQLFCGVIIVAWLLLLTTLLKLRSFHKFSSAGHRERFVACWKVHGQFYTIMSFINTESSDNLIL